MPVTVLSTIHVADNLNQRWSTDARAVLARY
jgi:hypothetical protein